jgi:hypothetical protein
LRITSDCAPDPRQKLRLSSLEQLDGRTNAAREARDFAAALESDAGGDPSAAQRALIEQASCLKALCGDYGLRHLSGQLAPDEIPIWLSSINNFRRLLETLGLERKARDVSLHEYLAQKSHRRAPNEQSEAS